MNQRLAQIHRTTMNAVHKALEDDRTESNMIRDHNRAGRYSYLGPVTEHENNIVNATRRTMRDTQNPRYRREFLRSFFRAKLVELADLDKSDAP